MSRDQLTQAVRTHLLAGLKQKLRQDRIELDRRYPKGASDSGLRDSIDLIGTQNTLLTLVGAVFGDQAERDIGQMLDWDAADGLGRVPHGSLWLSQIQRAASAKA